MANSHTYTLKLVHSTLRGYEALESHLESVSRTLQSLAAVGAGGVGGGGEERKKVGGEGERGSLRMALLSRRTLGTP